ncbi:MAG TPA: SUF system Fe-S cluster assembly regulator, partial [Candidatus Deferrimicrobiaceae bacterium]
SMRLSKLADYGTVVMGYMAGDPAAVHTATGIAAAIGVAPPTVSKLLKLLSRRSLLVSLRGSRGGYRLSRRPDSITVAEVVEAVEGTIALTECSGAMCRCSVEPGCTVQRNWRQINRRLRGVLDGVTVADLARKRTRRGPSRRPSGAVEAKPAAIVAAGNRS